MVVSNNSIHSFVKGSDINLLGGVDEASRQQTKYSVIEGKADNRANHRYLGGAAFNVLMLTTLVKHGQKSNTNGEASNNS